MSERVTNPGPGGDMISQAGDQQGLQLGTIQSLKAILGLMGFKGGRKKVSRSFQLNSMGRFKSSEARPQSLPKYFTLFTDCKEPSETRLVKHTSFSHIPNYTL